MNKKKIINDPLYGLITIPNDLIFDIIEHPYFQRLRRIKQLGLTEFVYPGATHNRFHHAVGAMYLMSEALNTLRQKGIEISDDEYQASLIAILLHDIGHGPFSHTLEQSLLHHVRHEELSLLIMQKLNNYFNQELEVAIQIFKDEYPRKFFHQLVSSQLDVDRLDYLSRDSFFTGVVEGSVGVDRILKLINVSEDQLVVEEKGIYSLENFLSSRRLMYWQVYFHKTVVGIEKLLVQLIKRAKFLAGNGENLHPSGTLKEFLLPDAESTIFEQQSDKLEAFLELDDYDIWSSIKLWTRHPDCTLAILSKMIFNRILFKVQLSDAKPTDQEFFHFKEEKINEFSNSGLDWNYLLLRGEISNAAYLAGGQSIKILRKNNLKIDIDEAADLPNIKGMSKIVKKYYLCWPKSLSL